MNSTAALSPLHRSFVRSPLSFIRVLEKPSFPRMIHRRRRRRRRANERPKGVTTLARPETDRPTGDPCERRKEGRRGGGGCRPPARRLTSGRAPSRLLVCEMSCVSRVRGDFTLSKCVSSSLIWVEGYLGYVLESTVKALGGGGSGLFTILRGAPQKVRVSQTVNRPF